ncbi:hypothetical protein F2Q69_00001810 [Brassica cretica]|uniref:Uncharacterized protein n=1 Tax=Brassica cretica TaxID=69181 RepID=A0A8S9NTT6_BRACR|nr:hypothetical protein F2Q69_00001810 [Brassica cretica]
MSGCAVNFQLSSVVKCRNDISSLRICNRDFVFGDLVKEMKVPVLRIKVEVESDVNLGKSDNVRNLGTDEPEKFESDGNVGDGFNGGDGNGGGGDGDGNGGDDGEEDYEEKEFGPVLKFEEVMRETEARGAKLPSDMLEAAKTFGIRKLLLLRYLDLQSSAGLLGFAIRSWSMLRNRILADPSFLFKIGTEIVIDSCCATVAEVQKRGKDFWAEFELYVADLLVGVVVNVALVVEVESDVNLGKSDNVRNLGTDEPEKFESDGNVGDGFNGGDGNGGGGDGDGNGGDDGEEDYEEKEFGPVLKFEEVMRETEARGAKLPSDMLEAAKTFGIRKLLLLRYLDLQSSAGLLGFAIRSWSMLRNRILADPSFLFKIGTEIVIDSCCATVAEVQKRGKDFWAEFELYVADLLVGVVVNVALVGMLAPFVRFGQPSASTGSLGRMLNAYTALPSSVFEAERPGCSFSAQQRLATYFYKGIMYGAVGFGCGIVGQGIANLIMTAKRSINKSEEDIPVPPLIKSAALWGVFLSVSSNTRYQIINGLERVVEASPFAKKVPPAALAFTVGVRFANNIYGGMQFVDWARLSGLEVESDVNLGKSDNVRNLGTDEPEKFESDGNVGDGFNGGDGNGGGGDGDGNGGDDGEEDYEEKEFGPVLKFEEVMRETEARGAKLPSDMLEAAKTFGIRKLLLLRYLDLQSSAGLLGFAIRSWSMLRNRILADPSFLFKIGTEIVIDSCCATVAEVQKRGKDFWAEFELYVADLLVGVVVNVALVGMLAPFVRFGQPSASTDSLGRMLNAYNALPSSVFEAERPGCSFSAQQRLATYFYKGIMYGAVGFGCGIVGQGIANLIMTAKRSINKSEEDIPVPPLIKSAALWGVFLSVSSNTRYQIINGLERVVEASPFAKKVPPAALAFTVGARFANNIYGGMQFVDWARLSGCQ